MITLSLQILLIQIDVVNRSKDDAIVYVTTPHIGSLMKLSQTTTEAKMLGRIRRLMGKPASNWRVQLDPIMASISGKIKDAYDNAETPLAFLTQLQKIRKNVEEGLHARKIRLNKIRKNLEGYSKKFRSDQTWTREMFGEYAGLERTTERLEAETHKLAVKREPLVQFCNLVKPILTYYIRREH